MLLKMIIKDVVHTEVSLSFNICSMWCSEAVLIQRLLISCSLLLLVLGVVLCEKALTSSYLKISECILLTILDLHQPGKEAIISLVQVANFTVSILQLTFEEDWNGKEYTQVSLAHHFERRKE